MRRGFNGIRIIKGLMDGYGNRLYNKDVDLRLYRRASALLATPRYWGARKTSQGRSQRSFWEGLTTDNNFERS